MRIRDSDLNWVEQRGAAVDRPSRSQVARELCHRLRIYDALGRPREVAARIALSRLERRGVVQLPVAAPGPPRRPLHRTHADQLDLPLASATSNLSSLHPIEIIPVARDRPADGDIWRHLMDAHHYLGAGPLCGAQIRYLIRSPQGWLGALSFSSGAWRLRARDQWIGWTEAARRRNLQLVVCNSRFLLIPRIQNLASHVLSLVLKRLGADWEERYGYRPLLVETFVDPRRFDGTCYRGAGWTVVGETTGRGRQDTYRDREIRPKQIFLRPLVPDARRRLRVEPISELCTQGDWADTEFARAKLPDLRLTKRLGTIARDFYARPTASIPGACGHRSKTKAVYRFCSHEGVGMDEILKPHYEASLARAANEKVVLAVQDTTSLNYSTHPATQSLGPIGSYGAQATIGLHLHGTLLVNPAGTSLGLIDVQCWARDPKALSKSQGRDIKSLPIDQKESRKWLKSYQATTQAQQRLQETRLVNVGDREADIYDLFEAAGRSDENPGLLIRAAQPRKLMGKQEKLWDHVRSLEPQGLLPLEVPRRGSRPARQTTLELRFDRVELRPPKTSKGKPSIKMWAIAATEVTTPPKGPKVEWLLLTTLPVTTLDEAAEKLHWYTLRWQIEVFHRTLKSGCRLEDRQLGSGDSLKACIAIDVVVAWRIFHLAKLGREIPDVPCTIFFEEAEWKALTGFVAGTGKSPEQAPTLREAIHLVASLGGFLGRKSDGEPGTQTLWRGLQRLDDITMAYRVFVVWRNDTS